MKKWEKKEEEFLINQYGVRSGKFIADKLSRSVTSVKAKAKQLKLITYSPKKWNESEIKFLKENYEKFGRKFVAEKLNRISGSVQKKAREFNLKFNRKTPKISLEELSAVVMESYCFSDVMKNMKKVMSGNSMRILKKNIAFYNIDTSHFDPFKKNRENCTNGLFEKAPIESWLIVGSNIGSSGLKLKLYKEGLKKHECEKCGQGEIWKGEKISLILDHKNGIRNDNRLENLRIVCPNCNAALPTHCRGHKKQIRKKNSSKETIKKAHEDERIKNNGLTSKKIDSTINARKVNRPPFEQLSSEIKELGYVGTGRKYGVSDNAIRKWIKFYEQYTT